MTSAFRYPVILLLVESKSRSAVLEGDRLRQDKGANIGLRRPCYVLGMA